MKEIHELLDEYNCENCGNLKCHIHEQVSLRPSCGVYTCWIPKNCNHCLEYGITHIEFPDAIYVKCTKCGEKRDYKPVGTCDTCKHMRSGASWCECSIFEREMNCGDFCSRWEEK